MASKPCTTYCTRPVHPENLVCGDLLVVCAEDSEGQGRSPKLTRCGGGAIGMAPVPVRKLR